MVSDEKRYVPKTLDDLMARLYDYTSNTTSLANRSGHFQCKQDTR